MSNPRRPKLDAETEQMAETVAQFARLVHARGREQFSEAADAQETLERLGVLVRFRRPCSSEEARA